jgi:hypothetical protein
MKTLIAHKTPVIRCPHCGAEYLPGEIYMPGALIGQPDDIVKDAVGKIIYEDYSTEAREPDMIEHFTCYYCEKPFVIEATVTYKSMKEAPEADFSTQYVSLLD